MPKINKTIYSSTFYAGVTIFQQASSFLLMPILTRAIEPFYYGVLATFQAIYPIGESFIDMGSAAAVSRQNFETDNTKEKLGRYIFNTFITKLFFLVVFSIGMFALSKWLINEFSFPFWLTMTIPGLAFASAFILLVIKLWIAQKKVHTYSIFQCSRVILNIGFSILLVVTIGLGWKGRILGIVIVEVFFMIICLLFLLLNKLIVIKIEFSVIKEILRFGMPLFACGIGTWTMRLTDRFFLNVMTDVSITGIYSVGYALGSVIEFIAGGVGFAVMPVIFEKLKNNPTDTQKISMVKKLYFYFAAMLCITIGWVLTAPYFVKLFIGKSYFTATRYIAPVAFAYLINSMYRIFSIYITYSKKTYYLTYAALTAGAVNLILNYILIKASGPMGAAQSTLISYIVIFILGFIFMQRTCPMPWFYFLKTKVSE